MACQSTSALGQKLSSVMLHCSFSVCPQETQLPLTERALCLCRGLLGTVKTVAQEEGPKALWNGLEAGAPARWPC